MDRSPEYARRLWRKATDDEWAFRQLCRAAGAPDWTLGFHAQQAVEKALKAVLTMRGIGFPFTHDLAFLLALLAQSGIAKPPDSEKLLELNPYAAALRYDDVDEQAATTASLDRVWTEAAIDRTLAWAKMLLEG